MSLDFLPLSKKLESSSLVTYYIGIVSPILTTIHGHMRREKKSSEWCDTTKEIYRRIGVHTMVKVEVK